MRGARDTLRQMEDSEEGEPARENTPLASTGVGPAEAVIVAMVRTACLDTLLARGGIRSCQLGAP